MRGNTCACCATGAPRCGAVKWPAFCPSKAVGYVAAHRPALPLVQSLRPQLAGRLVAATGSEQPEQRAADGRRLHPAVLHHGQPGRARAALRRGGLAVRPGPVAVRHAAAGRRAAADAGVDAADPAQPCVLLRRAAGGAGHPQPVRRLRRSARNRLGQLCRSLARAPQRAAALRPAAGIAPVAATPSAPAAQPLGRAADPADPGGQALARHLPRLQLLPPRADPQRAAQQFQCLRLLCRAPGLQPGRGAAGASLPPLPGRGRAAQRTACLGGGRRLAAQRSSEPVRPCPRHHAEPQPPACPRRAAGTPGDRLGGSHRGEPAQPAQRDPRTGTARTAAAAAAQPVCPGTPQRLSHPLAVGAGIQAAQSSGQPPPGCLGDPRGPPAALSPPPRPRPGRPARRAAVGTAQLRRAQPAHRAPALRGELRPARRARRPLADPGFSAARGAPAQRL